jgi:hypothetical protein
MSQYYNHTPNIPEYIFLLEDTQRKAAMAHLAITDQTLIVLASTALLATDTFPRTTELWEELDPANKTWAAWKTTYLAAHKKRANRLRATGGDDYLGQANSAHATALNPGLLGSIDNALDYLASAASNEKVILEQLIASNSSLAASNSTLTNQVKTLHDQLAAKSRGDGGRRGGSNEPTRGADLTLRATSGLMATALDMATLATPAPTPRKFTSPLPRATTSWATLSPTKTGRPTGQPEAPVRMYKQNLSLLRPLIFLSLSTNLLLLYHHLAAHPSLTHPIFQSTTLE